MARASIFITKINMDPYIEYISTDADGNYEFSYAVNSFVGEFILPPNSDGVEIISKMIDGGIVKTESITKLQELGII